jgi:hypothetical protein
MCWGIRSARAVGWELAVGWVDITVGKDEVGCNGFTTQMAHHSSRRLIARQTFSWAMPGCRVVQVCFKLTQAHRHLHCLRVRICHSADCIHNFAG